MCSEGYVERIRENWNKYIPIILKLDKGCEATPAAEMGIDKSNATKSSRDFRSKASLWWPYI